MGYAVLEIPKTLHFMETRKKKRRVRTRDILSEEEEN